MRNFGVLFLALIVIFFFFAGFYLFIVPANQSATDKYGVLTLQQLETAIGNKMDADIGKYSAYLEPYYFRSVKKNLDSLTKHLTGQGVNSLEPMGADPGRPANRPMLPTDTQKVYGRVADIRPGRIVYEFSYGSEKIRLGEPLSGLLGDLWRSFPTDFFKAFLLLRTDSTTTTTLYKNDALPLGLHVRTDSLLKKSERGFYPGIGDLNAGSSQYKLFFVPLVRDDLQFILCGVKDAGQYDREVHSVPTDFLYPIVIMLILLLVALPIVKFYTIGPTEAVRLQDIVALGFSLLCGSMMITVIIIQLILLKDGEVRQQIGLHRVSEQIDTAFGRELRQAFGGFAAPQPAGARRSKTLGRACLG